MAVYLKVHGTSNVHRFLGTLATAASYWSHAGETMDVLLNDGSFAAAPLTMPLADLLAANGGFSGNGSEDAPISICVVRAGVQAYRYGACSTFSSLPSWMKDRDPQRSTPTLLTFPPLCP